MAESFYNTIESCGQQLIQFEQEAKNQQEKILEYFSRYPANDFTPDEIHIQIFSNSVPITSVRRSMTNLTNAGLLQKTDIKRLGRYGKLTHTWKLK